MKYVDIVLFKVWADLRAEASRAYIGFLWWFLEPLLYMGAFYLIFGLGLRVGGEGFIYFLLCGLIPWKWFSSTMANGSKAIEAGAGMIHQVYLPKIILPTIIVLINTAKFLMILPLFMIFLLLSGYEMTMTWFLLVPLVLLQLLVVWSLTSFCAAIVPFIPDLRYVIENGLLMLLFLSGTFFSIDDLNDTIRFVLYLNPIAVLIDSYRSVLLENALPKPLLIAYVVAFSAVFSALSVWLLNRFDRRYPKVL